MKRKLRRSITPKSVTLKIVTNNIVTDREGNDYYAELLDAGWCGLNESPTFWRNFIEDRMSANIKYPKVKENVHVGRATMASPKVFFEDLVIPIDWEE